MASVILQYPDAQEYYESIIQNGPLIHTITTHHIEAFEAYVNYIWEQLYGIAASPPSIYNKKRTASVIVRLCPSENTRRIAEKWSDEFIGAANGL